MPAEAAAVAAEEVEAAALVEVAALVAEETTGIRITNTAEWNAALDSIKNGGNDKAYTLVIAGSFDVPGVSASNFGTVTGITVTLKGSGTMTLNSNGGMLYIAANQTLVIDGAGLTLKGRPDNNRSVIVPGSGSTLELRNGTISGNTSIGGGGVTLTGSFTMSGGTISGNTASIGGGVMVSVGGSFTMSGGTISGNAASSTGGGVSLTSLPAGSGSFTMTGGIISGNTAGRGGGVYADSVSPADNSTFIKTGGIIYGNDGGANANTATNTGTTNGHAVFYFWSASGSNPYHNTTLNAGDNLSTSDRFTGWTGRT